MIKKVIAFGGYHATGGSVIRDILKEYQEIFVFPTEFRILIQHKGLLDLENTIFENGGCENIDLAIKDFLWLCSNLARKTTKLCNRCCLSSGAHIHNFAESDENCVIVSLCHPGPIYTILRNLTKLCNSFRVPSGAHLHNFQTGNLE